MKRIFSIISIIVAASIPLIAAHAEPRISKDWVWDTSPTLDDDGNEFVFAGTNNSEGRVLGQKCTIADGTCLYFVELGITCEPDSEYPSIINSEDAAIAVSLICAAKLSDGSNILQISPFSVADDIILTADSVGFAVALHKGTSFKVVRFSLSGSSHAIEMMRIGAELLQKRRSGSATHSSQPSEEYL